MKIFLGILIPFLGTTLGASCVFFMKRSLGDLVQRALAGFAAGVLVFDAANRTAVKMIAKTHGSKVRRSRIWALISRFPTLPKRSVRGIAACRSPAEAICWATPI